MADVKELLRGVAIFKDLDDDEIQQVAEVCKPEDFVSGEYIFREGESGNRLYLVVEGEVRISRNVPGSGEEALAVLKMGALFGEMAVFDRSERSTDAISNGGTKTLTISRPNLRSCSTSTASSPTKCCGLAYAFSRPGCAAPTTRSALFLPCRCSDPERAPAASHRFAKGLHLPEHQRLSADLWGLPAGQLRDSELVSGLLIAAAGAAGFNSLGIPAVRQRPDGAYGAALLLDEAHLVVHALPEQGLLVLDFFAPTSLDLGKALEVFTRRLNPAKIHAETRRHG